MLLTSGNCLDLSVAILLTLQDDLFSAPRMECKPARHPRSIYQPVGSQNCIRDVIYWSHAHDNGMPELVMATRKWKLKDLCTDELQNATVCKACSCGTVKIGKVYYILQAKL